MTDNLRTWLDERETIHRNGWTGEWSWTLDELDRSTLRSTGPVDFDLIRDDEFRGPSEVLEEFVDAHNTLPKLLAGMRRVLELHSEDEETGWCNECTEGHMDYVSYPCPTIQELQEAINDE